MSASHPIPPMIQRVLVDMEKQIRAAAARQGMNGATDAFVKEQMETLRKEWFHLEEQSE